MSNYDEYEHRGGRGQFIRSVLEFGAGVVGWLRRRGKDAKGLLHRFMFHAKVQLIQQLILPVRGLTQYSNPNVYEAI